MRISQVHWLWGALSIYIWLSNVSASGRRHYIYNFFAHRIILCSTIDRKPNKVKGFVTQNTTPLQMTSLIYFRGRYHMSIFSLTLSHSLHIPNPTISKAIANVARVEVIAMDRNYWPTMPLERISLCTYKMCWHPIFSKSGLGTLNRDSGLFNQ